MYFLKSKKKKIKVLIKQKKGETALLYIPHNPKVTGKK